MSFPPNTSPEARAPAPPSRSLPGSSASRSRNRHRRIGSSAGRLQQYRGPRRSRRRGLIETAGVVPACPSLDCISIFSLTVRDAWHIASIARGVSRVPSLDEVPTRFAVPKASDLEFFGDKGQEELYRQAIARLERMGLAKTEIDFTPFRETAKLLYEGPWIAERLSSLESFLATNRDDFHPVTRTIIETGAKYRATDLFRGLAQLEGLRRQCKDAMKGAQLLVVPTMPTIPTRDDVAADSLGWSRRMGTYTNFVNLLGMAALAVPSGFTPERLPGGVTFIGPGGSDRLLCGLGVAWQKNVNLPLGAIKTYLPETPKPAEPTRISVAEGHVRVSVAGAHLKGQPLHPDMVRFGAKFVRVCDSAPRYRFMAFMNLSPPRPRLLWDETRNGSIRLEIYDLPFEGFGKLVASVAPPLAIGTVELEDGEKVKGFLCESWAARAAEDITDFGGWIAFRTGGGRCS